MMRPLVIDNFAGGGGASTGIERAIGRAVDVAINHDPEAVAMHLANHPGTKHYCQSIMAVDPLEATGGAPVALAWFSPDCKHHSKAKGGKPREKNIRDLAWIVVHWAERLRKATPRGIGAPAIIMLENVEEFRQWGPLDGEGKPIPERKGEEFDLWLRGLKRQGYKVEHRELRACDYGAPTSRKRLFLIARRDGRPIMWPKPTHGKPGSPEVERGERLPWRTAAGCIDWSIPCPSIFDRKRSLKDTTHRRIAHGVMRYVVKAQLPFIVGAGGPTYGGKPKDVADPFGTLTTENHRAVVDAAIIPITHTGSSTRVHDAAEPFRTITTANNGELARATVTLAPTKSAPGGIPASQEVNDDDDSNLEDARLAGRRRDGGFLRSGLSQRDADRAARNGGDIPPEQHARPEIHGAAVAFVGQHNFDRIGSPADDPLTTVTTRGTQQRLTIATMLQAACLDRQFGRSLGADVQAPAPAVTASGGGKTAAVTAFLSHFYTSNTNGGRGDPETPLKTITTGGQGAVVCAHMEQASTGGMIGRPADHPLTTITTSGSQQRLVETTLIDADALPADQLHRAVQVAAFLVKYYGAAEHGQALDRPIDTVTSLPRFAVVTVTIDAVTYVIVDIGMRMLTRRELANAQGFPAGYILDPVGPNGKPLSISSSIRMIGNSVCPDMAEALVRANVAIGAEAQVAA